MTSERAGRGRVHLSLRWLLNDIVRLTISVGGLGFSVALILILQGIVDGTVAMLTNYIDRVGADVFVARGGISNMALSASALPEGVVAEIAGMEGVEQAGGIVRFEAMVANPKNGKSAPTVMVGYSPDDTLGGPWKVTEGRGVEAPGEVVVDRVLAREVGAHLGDTLMVSGQQTVVVGFSGETAALAGKLVFVHVDTAQAVLGADGYVSYVLLRAKPGAAAGLADTVRAAHPELSVMTTAELSANDRRVLSDLFTRPINVMSGVGFLVGLAIVGLTMYTMVSERMRDFGVLKAIGASNGFLFRAVISQALTLGTSGFGMGLVAVLAVGPVLTSFFPDIGVAVTQTSALRALGAVLAMSLAGAVLPLVRIVRVDPLLVFKQ